MRIITLLISLLLIVSLVVATSSVAADSEARDVEKDQPRGDKLIVSNVRSSRSFDICKRRAAARDVCGKNTRNNEGKGGRASHIFYPQNLHMELRAVATPTSNRLTRTVEFIDWTGQKMRVPVNFTRDGDWYIGDAKDPDGDLHDLAVTGNRWHWDNMRLRNNGGSTRLEIQRMKMEIIYDLSSTFKEVIPVIDRPFRVPVVLNAGTHSISLNAYARGDRKKFASQCLNQPVNNVPLALKFAINDLGKSGSDGKHFSWENNPKYGQANSYLCSEFVSWYYARVGYVLVIFNSWVFRFDHVTGTNQMHIAFLLANRLYCYDATSGVFEHIPFSAPLPPYIPQPGDFLERRNATTHEAEHSMLVMKWDERRGSMTVINGPWPVTVRRVNVADDTGHQFCVGRID